MSNELPDAGLRLLDDLVADDVTSFTFSEAVRRSGRSPTATSNLLRRMQAKGLVERVRRGRYAIRRLGVLGTSTAAEGVALAVGAAFSGRPHRIGYRSALDEHDLVTHPARTIQVALAGRTRASAISSRPLRVVMEPPEAIGVGASRLGESHVSDLERSLLDAAARPDLAGGAATLAEAVVAAGSSADPQRLTEYAERLSWAAALRRIGSLADALEVRGLANRLRPLSPPTGDLDLDPSTDEETCWRDPRWRVRWSQTPAELESVARQ